MMSEHSKFEFSSEEFKKPIKVSNQDRALFCQFILQCCLGIEDECSKLVLIDSGDSEPPPEFVSFLGFLSVTIIDTAYAILYSVEPIETGQWTLGRRRLFVQHLESSQILKKYWNKAIASRSYHQAFEEWLEQHPQKDTSLGEMYERFEKETGTSIDDFYPDTPEGYAH